MGGPCLKLVAASLLFCHTASTVGGASIAFWGSLAAEASGSAGCPLSEPAIADVRDLCPAHKGLSCAVPRCGRRTLLGFTLRAKALAARLPFWRWTGALSPQPMTLWGLPGMCLRACLVGLSIPLVAWV